MTNHNGWKSTPVGQLACFIGSVKFAVPVLALTAAAMSWGTWVDSTVGREAAMGGVYGSWWFITLMVMICASLILSVAVRYPWQRKHVGFIIVHASMISLIGLGFFTMFTKVEGRIILDKGQASQQMQMDKKWVRLLSSNDRSAPVLDYTFIDGTGKVELGEDTLYIKEIWANSEEVTKILNDSPTPLHAVEIITAPGQTVGDWVGQVDATQAAPTLGDFALRVMPTGETWTPPTDEPWAVYLDQAGAEHSIPNVGESLGESAWTVTSIEYFERATIGAGSVITERENGPPNPAVVLVLTHTYGSVEQQMAFERFRDSPFIQQLEGETTTGVSLTYRGEFFAEPTLAVMRDKDGRVHAVYAEPGAAIVSYQNNGEWPWEITVAGNEVKILQDITHARRSTTLEERPEAESSSPAIVVAASEDGETTVLRWRMPAEVSIGDRTVALEYGPVMVNLPFRLELVEFRKTRYPGSEMAMAYESSVLVTTEGRDVFDFRIHMNHPYKQDGWKVYQSGYLSDSITVLQVTKDPGLVPMYLASIALCIGILVTFYSRSLSWGHPDIPMPFEPTGQVNAEEV